MDGDLPTLTKVSTPVPRRRAARWLWVVVVALAVGLFGFLAGIQLGPTREVSPIPVPTSTPRSPTTSQPTLLAMPTAVGLASPLPAGVYYLTETQAEEIAQVARFYEAYNAGDLATVIALLSDQARMVDCNYATRTTVSLVGPAAVADWIRGRFAEHDRWVVEFIQENPENEDQVVIVPVQRESDALLALGAPGGVKRGFAGLDFSVMLDSVSLRLADIGWGTDGAGVGAEASLCDPTAQR